MKKAIRQLGTGANVYFESEKYRVNDYKGKFLLIINSNNPEDIYPIHNREFEVLDDAVRVAEELQKIYPDGVPEAVLIEKVIDNILKESKGQSPTASVFVISIKKYKDSMHSDRYDFVKGEQTYSYEVSLSNGKKEYVNATDKERAKIIAIEQVNDSTTERRKQGLVDSIIEGNIYKSKTSDLKIIILSKDNENVCWSNKPHGLGQVECENISSLTEEIHNNWDFVKNDKKMIPIGFDNKRYAKSERYKTILTEENTHEENRGLSEETQGIGDAVQKQDAVADYIRANIETAGEKQQGQEQRLAFKYAKENGLWIDSLYDLGESMSGGGNENTLAYNISDGFIYKSNNLSNHENSILKLFDSIKFHNEIFECDKYYFVGFTGIENKNGNHYVEPIFKQQYLHDSEQATQEQIEAYMRELGFGKVNNHTFKNDIYIVSDLRPRNVLVDKEGNICVIDDIVKSDRPIYWNNEFTKEYIEKLPTPVFGIDRTNITKSELLSDLSNAKVMFDMMKFAGMAWGMTEDFSKAPFAHITMFLYGDAKTLDEFVKEQIKNNLDKEGYSDNMKDAYFKYTGNEMDKRIEETHSADHIKHINDAINSLELAGETREASKLKLLLYVLQLNEKTSRVKIESYAKTLGLQHGGHVEMKLVKEVIELAIVIQSRGKTFDEVLEIYENQPNLSQKTSESVLLNQYSTSLPIAWILGKFCQINKDGRYFEPSAGNGMLTIYGKPENFTVNEIDKDRIWGLNKQGFSRILNQDGREPFVDLGSFDAIITNPPFGAVGKGDLYKGVKLSKLEHVMVGNALNNLKSTGKAAIIVGGHLEYNENKIKGLQDWYFFVYLSANFNVIDVINVDSASLYHKMGTTFKIKIILIDGVLDKPKNIEEKANSVIKTWVERKDLPQEEKFSLIPVSSFEKLNRRING